MNIPEVSVIPAVTRAQMIMVDRLMIEKYGITLLQMMENAGRNLADLAAFFLGEDVKEEKIVVVAGGGNNGGGGMAAARHLSNRGANVRVFLTRKPSQLKAAPLAQLRALEAMGVQIESEPVDIQAELLIDALIGYGLAGAPKERAVEWIRWMTAWPAPVLSLDVPSGLDVDASRPVGAYVRAAATLTLALPKTGMAEPAAREWTGDVYVADISVPAALYKEIGISVEHLFSRSTIVQVIYDH